MLAVAPLPRGSGADLAVVSTLSEGYSTVRYLPYLVDYVRWDERSDRSSFARQSLQQLSGRTRGYIFQGLQNSSLPPRSAL
jgi:hypothetical protein